MTKQKIRYKSNTYNKYSGLEVIILVISFLRFKRLVIFSSTVPLQIKSIIKRLLRFPSISVGKKRASACSLSAGE